MLSSLVILFPKVYPYLEISEKLYKVVSLKEKYVCCVICYS